MATAYPVRLEKNKKKERCRHWQLRVKLDKDPATGKRPMVTETFDGTYREAQAACDRLLAEVDDGDRVVRTGWTLYEYATTWNDGRYAMHAIEKGTHDKNANMIKALCMHFGKANIADILPAHITKAYTALIDGKSPSGRKWSGTSLLTLHNVFHGMFAHAVEDGTIKANPCDKVERPRSDTPERKFLPISKSVEMVMRLSVSDNRALAVALILQTGMRPTEAVSVRWSDVADKAITVRREYTKTDAGARVIPIDDSCDMMLGLRRMLLEDALKEVSIDGIEGDMTITCDGKGRPLTYNALRLWWERNREEFGCGGWTLHEFRHTYLSNLAESGVHPKIMQELAGHSSPLTTLRIYSHVNKTEKVNAISALESAKLEAMRNASSSK
jgi:integrase